MATEDRLLPIDISSQVLHTAAKGVVDAAMEKLQPHTGTVAAYEISQLGDYTIYSQAALDHQTGILYKFENREVIVTPQHEETHGAVVTSVGDLYSGLVIRSIQVGPDGYPSHYMNSYALPRDRERVSEWSLDLSGFSEKDTPMLLDLALSIRRATSVDVRHFRLCEEALKRKERSYRTRRQLA